MTDPAPEPAAVREPFAFRREDFGDRGPNLETAVFLAIGAASACWENLSGAGVFDSTRAEEIGRALLAFVQDGGLPKHNPDAYLVKETR